MLCRYALLHAMMHYVTRRARDTMRYDATPAYFTMRRQLYAFDAIMLTPRAQLPMFTLCCRCLLRRYCYDTLRAMMMPRLMRHTADAAIAPRRWRQARQLRDDMSARELERELTR